MAAIKWDDTGKRYYHGGIQDVAIYPNGGTAKPWNGVTAVNENPSGAEPTKIWADDRNYLTLLSKEEFALTLEAYQAPAEFDPCDGKSLITAGLFANKIKMHGQTRRTFGLVYRELVGNDQNPLDPASKQNSIYHVVYGCKAAPSSKDHATMSDSPEATTMSWEINSTPIITDFTTKASEEAGDETFSNIEVSHVSIDARTLSSTQYEALYDLLYDEDATLPSPQDIYDAIYPDR